MSFNFKFHGLQYAYITGDGLFAFTCDECVETIAIEFKGFYINVRQEVSMLNNNNTL